MNENTCRLCLKTVSGDFQTIGQALKDTLCKPVLNLNLDLYQDVFICNKCMENLQMSFNFILSCVHMREGTKNNADLNQEQFVNINNGNSVDESKQMRCRFCTKTTESEDFILLNASKENMFLVDMLMTHIPELNLNSTEELLTCEICLKSLQFFLNFVSLNVEEKKGEFNEIQGMGDKNQIELKNVEQFTFKPIIKHEIVFCDANEVRETYRNQEEFTIDSELNDEEKVSNQEFKTEEKLCYEELNLKLEENDIKSELNGCESMQDNFEETVMDDSKINLVQCTFCSFQTYSEIDLKNHISSHEIPSADTIYKCDVCTYETKRKKNLKWHMSTHKNTSSKKMYKCEICTYKTKYKDNLKVHILSHKQSSEVTLYKCEICAVQTKYKSDLIRHMLTHKNSSNSTVYKCEICTYRSKYVKSINEDMLSHTTPSVVSLYKCEMCTYQSVYKSRFQRHMSTHKNCPLKCEMCSYVTDQKECFDTHVLNHNYSFEMAMYKCNVCVYQTKLQKCINKHMQIHKTYLNTKMYECEMCKYETKYIECIKEHMLTHKTPSEEILHMCKVCPFQTIYKDKFDLHVLDHINPPFKCGSCLCETFNKGCLD